MNYRHGSRPFVIGMALALVALLLVNLALAGEGSGTESDTVGGRPPAPAGPEPEVTDPHYFEWNPGQLPADSEGNPYVPPAPPVPPGQDEAAERPDAASAAYFKRFAGAFFQPRNAASTTYTYYGSGCIYANTAGYFVHEVQVPDGAVIDFIRFYYYDAVAANATMYVTTYDGRGNYRDVASVSSVGSGGFDSQGTSLNLPVDNLAESIVILWWPGVASPNMALCGARIRYQYTVGQAHLPAVMHAP